MEEHLQAIRFDFRERLHLSLDEVGQSITFGEAEAHIITLRNMPGTHTHASVSGWNWPASIADLVAIRHAEWYINVHRKADVPPIELPRPWPSPDDVTPEELEALEQKLQERSAFRD